MSKEIKARPQNCSLYWRYSKDSETRTRGNCLLQEETTLEAILSRVRVIRKTRDYSETRLFMQVILYFLLLKEHDQGQGNNGEENEENLMKTITEGYFEEIEKNVTPRALQECQSNSLLMAMKVYKYSSASKL